MQSDLLPALAGTLAPTIVLASRLISISSIPALKDEAFSCNMHMRILRKRCLGCEQHDLHGRLQLIVSLFRVGMLLMLISFCFIIPWSLGGLTYPRVPRIRGQRETPGEG